MVWRKCLARRRPCGSRRAAGDGLRSGPGDSDPNDIPKLGADSLELWYGIPAPGCEPGTSVGQV